MILEVKIQNFGARKCGGRQSFHFRKIPGGLNINIFFEDWYEASSYNKKQTQKYEFEIWVSKLFYFYPQKSPFLVFEEKHPKTRHFCNF